MSSLQLDHSDPKAPRNLRVEMEPYPHLRDDDGPILANDYCDLAKLTFIIETVNSSTREGL